jgi:hypothetical protein
MDTSATASAGRLGADGVAGGPIAGPWTPESDGDGPFACEDGDREDRVDDAAQLLTIEKEREVPGIRPTAVGDAGQLAGLPAPESDITRLDESEMPRSLVLQAADTRCVVVADSHGLRDEREGTQPRDPQMPEGDQL